MVRSHMNALEWVGQKSQNLTVVSINFLCPKLTCIIWPNGPNSSSNGH